MDMETVRVELEARSYDIVLAGGLDGLGEAIAERLRPARSAIIADTSVAELFGEQVAANCREAGLDVDLVTFPPGEASKCMAWAETLCRRLLELRVDRTGAVVALGGGVTGDLAGFAAGVYMRGLPVVQVPTTLLAMVDSSVGGKTGVNLPEGKNLVGVFHQPALVYAAMGALEGLPARELRSGLAEAVKHGVIRDPAYLDTIEREADALLGRDPAALGRLVGGSCRIKASVVAADEREGGVRAILNFGHTVGHAVEAACGYGRYRHGEAVAVGMAAAARLGERLTGFSSGERERLESILERLGLPTRFSGAETDAIVAAARGDKKAARGVVRFVLPRRIGEVEIVPVEDEGLIREAVEAVRE